MFMIFISALFAALWLCAAENYNKNETMMSPCYVFFFVCFAACFIGGAIMIFRS